MGEAETAPANEAAATGAFLPFAPHRVPGPVESQCSTRF